ncbi:MAG TPA: hypothetical protein VEV82_03130 [Actinomycetota bacterium]|nr:hypothetical protein [Actinomycetota bacterium]
MATTKQELTNPQVQGQTRDALDKLVAIAARIAEREGLLIEDPARTDNENREIIEKRPAEKRTGSSRERRSA